MVRITLGPVLGICTATSVRILLEIDASMTLKCIAREYLNPDSILSIPSLLFKANRPLAFTVHGLKPATEYQFYFMVDDGDEDEDSGRNRKSRVMLENPERCANFCTYPVHFFFDASAFPSSTSESSTLLTEVLPEKLSQSNFLVEQQQHWGIRIAFVSNHRLGTNSLESSENLWRVICQKILANRMKRLHLLVHLGGQIHAGESADASETVYSQATRIIQQKGTTSEAFDSVCELYRSLYRREWNREFLKVLLANICNIMTCDEGEIGLTGWPTKEAFKDSSTEFLVGIAARKVMWEYERQLWDEEIMEKLNQAQAAQGITGLLNTMRDSIQHEGHNHNIAGVGLCFVDQRYGRVFSEGSKDTERYLSSSQWDGIRRYLEKKKSDTNPQALIVVSGSPFALTKGSNSSWSGQPSAEQAHFLDLISQWKTTENREATLITGSPLCIGAHSCIQRQGKRVLEQMITSPITPLRSTAAKPDFKEVIELENGFEIRHQEFVHEINFGVVDVTMEIGKKPQIRQYLVIPNEDDDDEENEGWSLYEGNEGCCTLM